MIAVILSFSDDPARLDLRPAHRERSAALAEQGVLLAGGPFADQSGALLVFATDDMEVVRAALDDDPYYSAPGVRVETVQPWTIASGGIPSA
ncbi:YciI family protein [Agrococcus carbonis]|uniref:YCII-related domain-containing protein n=1 Tax=Agrococcus carbonis TaxID=684552 RepID=A0A1H1PGS6_9MICO|nr:YciI family protein [Agrococcus carbonis]SDS10354.1 hypothetical protein SAMN04489719_1549 [Agrococcus carbonis]